MIWLDYVLLLVLAYFIFKGARRGFVATVGAFIGILLGAWVAGHYYDRVAQWLIEFWDISIMLAIVLAFIGLYLLVNIVVGVTVKILTVVLHLIPLGKTTNKLIGAILGLAEGMLLIGFVIWIITLFPFENSFTNSMKESRVANYFESTTRIVRPLLPKGLREIDFAFLKDMNSLSAEKLDELRRYMPPDIMKYLQEYIDEHRAKIQGSYNDEIQGALGTDETTTPQ